MVALVLLFSWSATAQISVPPLSGRVVDQTGTLNRDQKAALEHWDYPESDPDTVGLAP